FVYSSTRPRYLAVLSMDAARHASVYFPDGPAAVEVAAGVDVALPSSILLDDVVGRETIYGVFCGGPFELEPLRRARESGGAIRAPEGCVVDELSFAKERPPR